ncbi:hypothetical protein JTB14_022442 [Gonioctena quinquepunctata]|nr:hypothetical protein JTB14_022442 [Gonioctena quinquepunctata]
MFHDPKDFAKKNKALRRQIKQLQLQNSDSDSLSSENDSESELDRNIASEGSENRNTVFDQNSELENLTQDLHILSLRSNQEQIPNMADPINYQELRLFLDSIPIFSGEPCELNNFCTACDEIFQQYHNASEAVKKLIFRAIISKLKAKALILVSSRIELTTWGEVKVILKQYLQEKKKLTNLFKVT